MIGSTTLQTSELYDLRAISHILSQVAIINWCAISRNRDGARGSQYQILAGQLAARSIGPSEGDIRTIHQSSEIGRIVARLRIGLGGAATSLVEADTRVNIRRFSIAAEQRGIVASVGIEAHVVACVFALSDNLSSAIAIEGDIPLAVGVKCGLCLQMIAVAACGIEITFLGSVIQGPSTITAAQSELEHVGFALWIGTRRNGDGLTVFAHDHSVTVVRLLVAHGEDAQVVVMSHNEVVGSSLKARGRGDLCVGRLGKATQRKEQHGH